MPRLLLAVLFLAAPAAQDDPQPEWPKEVPKDWATPQLDKETAKFPGVSRIEFADKGKWVACFTGRTATVYEFSKWFDGVFYLAQAQPTSGNPLYWRDYTGQVQKLGGKGLWVNSKDRPVAVSPDGGSIAVAKNDRTVAIHDPGNADVPRAEFDAHGRGLMDVFFRNRTSLVTVAAQEVRLWNLSKLANKPEEVGFGSLIRSVTSSPPDNRYLAMPVGRVVHALETVSLKGVNLEEDLEAPGGSVAFSGDGKCLLVVAPAGTATVYSSGGDWKRMFRAGGKDGVRALRGELDPTGKYLAWIDDKQTLRFVHVSSGFEVSQVGLSGFSAGTMTWHPDGKSLYLCAADGKSIRVYTRK